MQSNELEATDVWHEAGGTGVRHKEDSFMVQPRWLQGAMICQKMLPEHSSLKITRGRQMDGMTNKGQKSVERLIGENWKAESIWKKSQVWKPIGAKAKC